MTISYNRLGSNGRLGNQMFQYAALRGIADYHGYEWMVPVPNNYGTGNYGLFECFNMSSVSDKNFGIFSAQTNVTTGQFHFSEGFYKKCPDNVNIHDYFQTEKYFKGIEEQIRQDFTFNQNIVSDCEEIMKDVGDAIFLHVRRGDYIATPNHHPVQPIEYYEEALSKFDSDIPVLIFSDTLDWVREQKLFDSDRFLLSENHVKYPNKIKLGDGSVQQSLVPYWDLCLMSMCKGAIIANSSMSWWGAWLQDGAGKVVAPEMWFGSAYAHYNMNDLIPKSWEKI